jgi:adenylosuccinate lyase
MDLIDRYSCIHPSDFRYTYPELEPFLSENAFIRACLDIEIAHIQTLVDFGICEQDVLEDIHQACNQVTTEEVYAEEKRIKHDIRALVNCITKHMKPENAKYVHAGFTSFDVRDSATAVLFNGFINSLFLPTLDKLIKAFLEKANQYKATVQVGRTHGQYASPITYGVSLCNYVTRLVEVRDRLDTISLKGKIAGPTGVYNALSLFIVLPSEFETDCLLNLDADFRPYPVSTQIVPRDDIARLINELIILTAILANFGEDVRNLQRSEISEIAMLYDANAQVGSSAMPHKENPTEAENIAGSFQAIIGSIISVYLHLISDHQRDLRNSIGGRSYGSVLALAYHSLFKTLELVPKLVLKEENITRNLENAGQFIVTEGVQTLLGLYGFPDSHEAIRKLCVESKATGATIKDLLLSKPEFEEYLEKVEPTLSSQTLKEQIIPILENTSLYIGLSVEIVENTLHRHRKYLIGTNIND